MGDPLFLILSCVVISIIVYGAVTVTIEMSPDLLVRVCSMFYFGKRFLSQSMGFAPGWSVPIRTSKHY